MKKKEPSRHNEHWKKPRFTTLPRDCRDIRVRMGWEVRG